VKPFDIHALLEGLAGTRPVFHSEVDFQFALAWQIKEQTGLDVRVDYPHIPEERVYLDIWLPEVRQRSNSSTSRRSWTSKSAVSSSRFPIRPLRTSTGTTS